MKNKVITLTEEELLQRLKPHLFEFFQQLILKKHGMGFNCSYGNGVFIATNAKPEIPERTDKLEELIAEGNFSGILLQDFLREYFTSTGDQKQRALETRVSGIFLKPYFKTMFKDFTLEDFLNLDWNDYLKFRGTGIKVYIVMCEKFKKMGFDITTFAVFKKYEHFKNGGTWRNAW